MDGIVVPANQSSALSLRLDRNSNAYIITSDYTIEKFLGNGSLAEITVSINSNIIMGVAPVVVNFVGTGNSNINTDVLSYAWDFDDGHTSTEKDPIHTFTAAGTYAVKLMVKNKEDQKSIETKIITITAASVDTTAPRLSSLSPTDNATGVANSAHLVLTFNEAIQVGTGNILIKNVDGSVAKTIAVTDNNQVSILGTTVILNPSSDLNAGSSYYVNIAAGVVKDLAGNSFAGITDTTTYNFTTVAAPIALVEGTDLNDRLIATSQNESINGADGIDTVVYSGLRNSYTITKTNQNITITDIANSKSIDTLISIERLAFSDQNIALDLNGHAGTTAKVL